MRYYVRDAYKHIRRKKRVNIQLDEEMLFWLKRLADMNENKDREDNTLQRVVRTALFIHLKQKLPEHFKMNNDYFSEHNGRTGRFSGNERW